ncbi:MAG: NAD(P)-dependent oxidoreductase [Lachnospiraceae bacterium]|jgi:nucleoside-diphosphate-sugar epimerase|nr:NAD(P)-dependent oxidoreductase [Lachnospiraceae bacterium]MDD3616192.1 NAD(P)-dependent oxidoreductase [Lachnospiraceae bacterium]
MHKVIITGATSMIGRALIDECLEHHLEIYAVIRPNSPHKERLEKCGTHLHLVECQLDKLSELENKVPKGCDTFYHIAWANTGEARNKNTRKQSVNITYTLDALETAAKLGCTRFVGAGSQAEYGICDEDEIGPETPANPTTPYGVSKLAAGQLARLRAKELGIICVWPRIFSVYGIYEKDTTMIASSIEKMLAGESTEFTPAEQRWDYLYSKDAGRAYYLLGKYGKDQQVYCIGSGQAMPLKDYIYIMRDCINKRIKPGIGMRPYPKGAVMNLCADIDSLRRDTGFVPLYTFEKGIRETIEWRRSLHQ